MRRAALLTALPLCLTAAAACAADLSGRYAGTGDADGVVIELVQTRTVVTGTITDQDSPATAMIVAKTDGADRAFGSARIPDLGLGPFRVDFSLGPDGLTVRAQGEAGTWETALFLPQAAPPPPEPPKPGTLAAELRAVLGALMRAAEPDATPAEMERVLGCTVAVMMAEINPEDIAIIINGAGAYPPEVQAHMEAAYPDMGGRLAACESED